MAQINELLAVAVVEIQHGFFCKPINPPHAAENDDDCVVVVDDDDARNKSLHDESCSTQLYKVRIRQSDLSNSAVHVVQNTCESSDDENTDQKDDKPQAICTGLALNYIILQKCHEQISKDFEDCEELSIDNREWSSYYTVEVYNPSTCKFESFLDAKNQHCDILKTFGTRLRCIVASHQSQLDLKTSNNEHQSKELPQIMGRYFHYDPNGMEFAGRRILVKEMINNQIDGTGLNVWDGALLMYVWDLIIDE